MDIAAAYIGMIGAAILYFVPTFVAEQRGHPNKTAIGLTNLLLGWTFIGWAVALIWAATHFVKPVAPPKPAVAPRPPPAPLFPPPPPPPPPSIGTTTGGWG